MKSSTMTPPAPSKTLNIVLWIFQVLLGAMFIMAGAMKSFTPINELAVKAPWAADLPGLVRFIGISELLGGLGLLLPALTRIKPILTPIAASALALVMVLATAYHISKGENSAIGITIGMAAIALFIAWGRFKKAPIQPR